MLLALTYGTAEDRAVGYVAVIEINNDLTISVICSSAR